MTSHLLLEIFYFGSVSLMLLRVVAPLIAMDLRESLQGLKSSAAVTEDLGLK